MAIYLFKQGLPLPASIALTLASVTATASSMTFGMALAIYSGKEDTE